MTRSDILETASRTVCGDREDQYGNPENNFQLIANLWNDYLDLDGGFLIGPIDVAMMMALLKIARIKTGVGTSDSFVDLAGYAACGGEIETENNDISIDINMSEAQSAFSKSISNALDNFKESINRAMQKSYN